MTRRRWIADEVRGDTAALTGEHAAHLVQVLRARVGQAFDIATGAGVRQGTITSLSDTRVEFALGEEVASPRIPQVTLALAIYKFDRMEWAIEKCTEIGVARIVPVIARRTDTHLAAAAGKRRERWQRIARQASEQSRRSTPPEIAELVKVSDLAGWGRTRLCGEPRPPGLKPLLNGNDLRGPEGPLFHGSAGNLGSFDNLQGSSSSAIPPRRVVLAETEKNVQLRDVLAADATGAVLAIGPEGGWTAEELQWFREGGWVSASLGDTILRAETAAIVSAALAMDVLSPGRA